MKIDITKQEYRNLLDLIYLGEWMLGANDSNNSGVGEGHAAVVQKIFSLAAEMGCATLIERSKESGEFFPTREYDENTPVRDHIDAYDEECFWSQLIHRLTDRDLEVENKALGRTIESPEDYIRASHPIEEKYAEEFRNNGLSRIELRET